MIRVGEFVGIGQVPVSVVSRSAAAQTVPAAAQTVSAAPSTGFDMAKIIGIVGQVASAGATAYGAYREGKASNEAAKAQARLLELQSIQARRLHDEAARRAAEEEAARRRAQASPGMSTSTILMIAGGAVAVGLIAILALRK